MTFLPLRLRPLRDGSVLGVNDTGSFFAAKRGFADRLLDDALLPDDLAVLTEAGHLIATDDPFAMTSHAYGRAERLTRTGRLDYLILVPTLRCNLSCSYCQVSRVGITRTGFDWSDETLAAVLAQIDAIEGDRIKIEFQGGEPTLRVDLLRIVIARCERFPHRQFVICTNLQVLDDEILEIFDRADVIISTSLDGDARTHRQSRTSDKGKTDVFLANLETVIARYPSGKVAALPTIDPSAPLEIDALIEAYASRGLESIFLRPINFQGFARKRHAHARQQSDSWRSYYEAFVRRLVARNWTDRSQVLEEAYFSICLRRILQPGRDRHVDLRNPNPMGTDYIVVDYDGTVYPTDEARMLARSGIIDLSIGDIGSGWDTPARDLLNANATNQFDPSCERCPYQPFCGRDLVDDIARYGTIDLPRHETEFCRRHLHVFDFIFELIYDDDPAVRYSLSRWLRVPGDVAEFGLRLL